MHVRSPAAAAHTAVEMESETARRMALIIGWFCLVVAVLGGWEESDVDSSSLHSTSNSARIGV